MFSKRKNSKAEQFSQSLIDGLEACVVICESKTGGVLMMNSALKSELGIISLENQPCEDLMSDFFPDICDYSPRYLPENTQLPFKKDIIDKNGRYFSLSVNTIGWHDNIKAFSMLLQNVDEERKLSRKLYDLAYKDQLTGIPNRAKLKEDFEAITPDVKENRINGIIAIFDLDNFKAINDTYGHNTGDVMLRRIAEHFELNPAFKGHLYRLGGDEFVLFFWNSANRFPDEGALYSHYENLLSAAFVTYTMPNIETSCTLSMGVAFFPKHGKNYSELLRKSDIALYISKDSGRNCLTLFEDKYDTAKKFRDIYINMQPILSADGGTFAYEMIDKGSSDVNDEDSTLLADFDRTMDVLSLGDISGNAKFFIHFSKQLLNKSVYSNLPKSKFVVQINADSAIDDKHRLLECAQLCAAGYTIALCNVTQQSLKPDILKYATYIKLSLNSFEGASLQRLIRNNKKFFIASEINSNEDYNKAKNYGFSLFQGFYFSQPVLTQKTKDIDPLKANYYRLLKLTSTDDYVNFKEISDVISSDVALSYKLLKLLNSAAVGLRNRISSISTAVAYLGEESLKKWIAMLALRGLADDKPLELVRISLIRAQFGELLSPHFSPPKNHRHVFLTGMFSLLHIALEKTKEELFDEIPVADDIRLSIVSDSGPYSDLVDFYANYEYSNWDEVSRFAAENNLTDTLINESYIQAVRWFSMLTEDNKIN